MAQVCFASVSSETASYDQHISDTINNGHGLVNKDIAKLIIENGPLCIKWLEEIGVIFNRDNQNQLNSKIYICGYIFTIITKHRANKEQN